MERKWKLQFNPYGVPLITGDSQLDAIEAIGYANAQDRIIQMDYYRRFVTGRLSELYGVSTLSNDIEMIKFDFAKIATDVVENLCREDRQRLDAYCKGVNDFIREGKLPLEYGVLKYEPEEWTPESCILVNIYTHYVLNYLGLKDEIMLTILKRHLDEQVLYFYTPDKDRYSDFTIFGKEGKRTVSEFPRKQLEEFYKEALNEKRRIHNKINTFMDKQCQVKLCFEGEKSYEAFRTSYIQRKMQMILSLGDEEFKVELNINPSGSVKYSELCENTDKIHIEGFLPKYQKSVILNNAGFFEIMVSADISMKSFEGTGELSILKNEYFKYDHYELPHGSNCMILDGKRTDSGKPLLANDPHLPFDFPNLFYMLTMKYEDVYFQGFMVPGTPLMVSGNNKNICWGITSTASNFFDLVIIDPEHNACEECQKIVKVKVSKSEVKEEKVRYYKSKYGPLLEQKVDGETVAIHWTALDVNIYDYSFWNMVTATKTSDAVEIAQNAGCVPINIIIGDVENNIAWTIAGKIPKRVGLEGDSAEHWKEGSVFWDGYIEPEEKPIIINPAEGFIVNANDRTYGKEYPYLIGHDFANGWRTKRISDLLSDYEVPYNKERMWNVMTDINCEPYDLYYQLIQSTEKDMSTKEREELDCIFELLSDWNKQADKDCHALIVINCFRDKILQNTLSPIYYVAGKYQPFFSYQWFKFDEVIMSLWCDQEFYSEEFVEFYGYKTRAELFISMLYDVRSELLLLADLTKKDILELTWGDINRLNINMQAVRFAGYGIFAQLNKDKKLPKEPLDGAIMSVNACFSNSGPLYRLVIDLDDYRGLMVNHLGGNYGSLLSDSKFTQTSMAWASGEKVISKV